MRLTSYRTTILGIVAILSAATSATQSIFDGDPATVFDLDTTVTAIAAGLGLIFARDNSILALAALGSGCATDGFAKVVRELKDDNATVKLNVQSPWGVNIQFERAMPIPFKP
jgi:hypothetical protein